MAPIPYPAKDAVCGVPLSGEAISGTWIARPAEARLALAARPVAVEIESGSDVVLAVPVASLYLGARPVILRVDVSVLAGMPGVEVGALPVAITISSWIVIAEAGLALNANGTIVYVGAVWLWQAKCLPLDLEPADCEPLDLEPATVGALDLQPLNCR